MKWVFIKNNARKGMGEKGVLKRERKRSAQKGRERRQKKGEEKEAEKGLQNSRILKRMAGWAEIRKF